MPIETAGAVSVNTAAAEVLEKSGPMPVETATAVSGSDGFRNTRILMVDNDWEFARFVSEQMTGMGYLIETAGNGLEGLALFRSGEFPVVLAGLHTPGMNGIELLRNIKQTDRRAAVVIVAGFGTVDQAMSAFKNGAYDYILKPIAPARLISTVERAIEQRCLAKQVRTLRRLTLGLVVSIPFWIVGGIILALQYMAGR